MSMDFNIYSVFEDAAKKYGDRIAIIEDGKKINYNNLEIAVNKTTQYFYDKGIRKGDRVLVFVPMGIELYRIVLALFKMGATAVFLDEWVSVKRLKVCCRLANCKGFIGIRKARLMGWFIKELRQVPVKLHDKTYDTYNQKTQSEETKGELPALITFTTGSTGTPKAALRTHAFLKEQFDALIEEINPQAGDVDMTTLPIVLLINLGAGATSIIAKFNQKKPELLKASTIVEQIQNNKVNRITASPFFLRKLADHVLKHDIKLPSLKYAFTGGAPVFPKEASIFNQALANTETLVAYGSTEAEPISLITAKEVAEQKKSNGLLKGLAVGAPYHKTRTKIIAWTDHALNELHPLEQGAVGEIVVAGPHVLKQYFNNPEALKRNKIIVDDTMWHRTGDSGFFDEEGKLFLTGRCKTLFKYNDQLVCPFLIEDFILNLDHVTMGTILKKDSGIEFVLEGKDADKQQIEKELRNLKFDPFTVRWMDRIPRDPRHNSKIDYAQL